MESEKKDAAYDNQTRDFYDLRAGERAALYNSAPSPYLETVSRFIERGDRMLDVGCGSGRDLRACLDAGFDAYGVEPSAGMREEAKKNFSFGDDRIASGALPLRLGGETSWLREENFRLVLCGAVLQHIEENRLFEALFSLHRAVRDGGFLHLAVPLSNPAADPETGRDREGRLFILRPPEQYGHLLSRLGFDPVFRRDFPDAHGRSGVLWTNMVFQKTKGGTLRPIEQIESIIREDSKTTTYKFALLRALAEIAVTNPRLGIWEGSGRVFLPLEPIARKWMEYYWPLVRDKKPQGHTPPAGRSDMLFRKEMEGLIECFPASKGGLGYFLQSLKSGTLGDDTATKVAKLQALIGRAIIRGPVVYSGNAKTGGKIFEPGKNGFTLSADLWTELALLGRWIEDSIILRWAEYTSSLSGAADSTSNVLNLLLETIRDRRDVKAASDAFRERAESGDLICVWTNKKLDANFAVDHAIPFSLWRSNDLWNLFPADSGANSRKRDRLPSQNLVDAAKNRIFENWDYLYEKFRSRF